MKKLFPLSVLFFAVISLQAQLNYLPQASQRAQVSQTIGISTITIDYSRPKVNGRPVWGALVPYGMVANNFGSAKMIPWRAGANENTTITFEAGVKVEGKAIAAGTYGLHMIPKGNGDFTIIFSRNSTSWGSYYYDADEDALRVEVSSQEAPYHELLTYDFIEVESDKTTAALFWEKKMIPFRIEVPVNELVLERIEKDLRNQAGFNRVSWEQASAFALRAGKLPEAEKWINAGRAGHFFSQKTYQNTSTLAAILKAKGDEQGYNDLLNEAISIANTNELNQLGYQLLGQNNYAMAIKVFEENVKRNPNDPNVYDSLGEGYKTAGNKEMAIKNLRKSLSLNPPPAIKANSEKLLKELGEKLN